MNLLIVFTIACFFFIKISGKPNLKVIGGINATSEEFPSFVVITRKNPKMINKIGICGGTILNDRWALTAAHCFPSKRSHDVINVLEGYDINDNKALMKLLMHHPPQIEAYFLHPKFLKQSFFNDIALIKIQGHFNFSKRVAPVLLPNKCDDENYTQGTIVGYGSYRTEFYEVLQKATIQIYHSFNSYNCYVHFVSSFEPNAMLCAGTSRNGTGVCFGDSGGPLIVQRNDGQQILLGITSAKPIIGVCAIKNFPAVFTRVSYYLDWINNTITTNS